MKTKSILILIAITGSNIGISQTNIFPSNGDVGIGSSSPSAKLHIHQSELLGTSNGDFEILTRTSGNTGNTFQNNVWLTRDGNGSDWYSTRIHDAISIDGSFLTPGSDSRTWWERDPSSHLQSWGSSNNTYMTLRSGKLGLGTTNPTAVLHILGEGDGKELLRFDTERDWSFWQENSGSAAQLVLKPQSNGKAFVIRSSSDEMVAYFSGGNGTNRVQLIDDGLTVRDDGNVGIGTTDPDGYKLAVNGTVRAKEVIVDTGVV